MENFIFCAVLYLKPPTPRPFKYNVTPIKGKENTQNLLLCLFYFFTLERNDTLKLSSNK